MTDFSYSKDQPLILVGAGHMGGAMARGWLAAGLAPDGLRIIDPALSSAPPDDLADVSFCSAATAINDGVKAATLVIAIKPQMMDAVLPDLAALASEATLIMSVAAGTAIARFEEVFDGCAIVRAMPNIPALVRRGITGLAANGACNDPQKTQAEALVAPLGAVIWLASEDLIDAVTATSGSGPAYVFYLVESIAAAAIANDINEDDAYQIAKETVIGAATLLDKSTFSAGELRAQVTSPSGTTEAALNVLMAEDGMHRIIRRAVRAARDRAKELAKRD